MLNNEAYSVSYDEIHMKYPNRQKPSHGSMVQCGPKLPPLALGLPNCSINRQPQLPPQLLPTPTAHHQLPFNEQI